MSVIHYTEQKARKTHKCHWCGESIDPGEKYSKWRWVDFGDISTVKVHAECNLAWNSLSYPDNEDVFFGSFNRGCTCENGRCECKEASGE